MAHTRLRKFNTKDMYPQQALDNDACMIWWYTLVIAYFLAARLASISAVHKYDWSLVDLRVDWSDESPIANYVTRALNPPSAPSFGVAGDP